MHRTPNAILAYSDMPAGGRAPNIVSERLNEIETLLPQAAMPGACAKSSADGEASPRSAKRNPATFISL
jgi:hypothetical protein